MTDVLVFISPFYLPPLFHIWAQAGLDLGPISFLVRVLANWAEIVLVQVRECDLKKNWQLIWHGRAQQPGSGATFGVAQLSGWHHLMCWTCVFMHLVPCLFEKWRILSNSMRKCAVQFTDCTPTSTCIDFSKCLAHCNSRTSNLWLFVPLCFSSSWTVLCKKHGEVLLNWCNQLAPNTCKPHYSSTPRFLTIKLLRTVLYGTLSMTWMRKKFWRLSKNSDTGPRFWSRRCEQINMCSFVSRFRHKNQ